MMGRIGKLVNTTQALSWFSITTVSVQVRKCVTVADNIRIYQAVGLDFIILVLTVIGLRRNGVLSSSRARPEPLWRLVYRQGVCYFVITFIVNLPVLVSTVITSI